MRLISQNGKVDVNYEKCVLLAGEKYIEAKCGDDKYYMLATYSKCEDVDKAMERLHHKYELCSGKGVFKFPTDSEVV
jgi:hypothetical protein